MAENKTYYAFTTRNNGRARQLKNDVRISYNNETINALALWDTGATSTCISSKMVDKLNLVPTGMIQIQSPAGKKDANTYLVDVTLPNEVNIKNLKVSDSDIGDQGLDMLIGMDIIGTGDFSVSNYQNNTVFSFRVPSKETTDYVKQIKIENAIGPRHGGGKKKHKRKK